LGATTNSPSSKATKLYSPHLPFVHFDEQWIKMYCQAGYCGNRSNVYLIKEELLLEAYNIAVNQGISCEPSGIAGLALFLQLKDTIDPSSKILIINTGKTKY
jgi:threonine synthase